MVEYNTPYSTTGKRKCIIEDLLYCSIHISQPKKSRYAANNLQIIVLRPRVSHSCHSLWRRPHHQEFLHSLHKYVCKVRHLSIRDGVNIHIIESIFPGTYVTWEGCKKSLLVGLYYWGSTKMS